MDKKTEYMKKVMSILSSAEEQDCSPSLSVEIKKALQRILELSC